MSTAFDEQTGPFPLAARLGRALDMRPRLTRWLLAGPGAVAASLLFAMAMPIWLPKGAAGGLRLCLRGGRPPALCRRDLRHHRRLRTDSRHGLCRMDMTPPSQIKQ